MDEILERLKQIENKICSKNEENKPTIINILEKRKRKLEKENDNLKKTNEMLNYKLDQLTRDRRFKITKSKKTYEIRDNLIFSDGIEIGFFVDSVDSNSQS
jgi:dTDP-D-glucose 4,6-dehydratase